MPRPLLPALLLLTSLLWGCQSVESVGLLPRWATITTPDQKHRADQVVCSDSEEFPQIQNPLAGIDHDFIKQMIAETPAGAQVSIVTNDHRQYSGTLLKAKTAEVELMNCIGKEVVPAPDGRRQCKTSHVPLQIFKISTVCRFMVISPPAPNFVAPDVNKDTRTVSVAEIVYKDGRHQRLGAPLDRENPGATTAPNGPDR